MVGERYNHPWHRGSIPLSTTKGVMRPLFYCIKIKDNDLEIEKEGLSVVGSPSSFFQHERALSLAKTLTPQWSRPPDP